MALNRLLDAACHCNPFHHDENVVEKSVVKDDDDIALPAEQAPMEEEDIDAEDREASSPVSAKLETEEPSPPEPKKDPPPPKSKEELPKPKPLEEKEKPAPPSEEEKPAPPPAEPPKEEGKDEPMPSPPPSPSKEEVRETEEQDETPNVVDAATMTEDEQVEPSPSDEQNVTQVPSAAE